MTDTVEISLVGAKTYGTLTRVFEQDRSYPVTHSAWAELKKEKNIATGAKLFCLTADLPPKVDTSRGDMQASDLRDSGLSGEVDTGAVEHTLDSIAALDEVEAARLAAEEAEIERQLAEGESTGETTPTTEGDTATTTAPKKVTLGGKGSKPVTV